MIRLEGSQILSQLFFGEKTTEKQYNKKESKPQNCRIVTARPF
ncbi:hypothetical protein BVRB_2g039260 [Beta vulgaris subsp. vulgaris]|nr:hypothetical protein BVRB_2g039260 [Beta vulgaris subsp. vulgaris]